MFIQSVQYIQYIEQFFGPFILLINPDHFERNYFTFPFFSFLFEKIYLSIPFSSLFVTSFDKCSFYTYIYYIVLLRR